MPPVDHGASIVFQHAGGVLAHLVQTGFGGFYDGMAHSLVTPEDAMVMTALALLSCLGGRGRARLLVVALPLGWFVAGATMLSIPSLAPPRFATTLTFGLIGLLVALDQRLPKPVFLGLTLVASGLHGAGNGAAMRDMGAGWLGLTGACVAVFIVASLLPAALAGIRKPAALIAVRVGGSWLVAVALLMIGWAIRQG